MGTSVHVTLESELKPTYTVATDVLPGLFAVAANQLAIWIGNTTGAGKSFDVNGINKCLGVIRENDTPTPLTTNVSRAKITAPGLRNQVVAAFNAVAEEPDETELVIVYGSAFQTTDGGSVSPHVKRALERYLEDVQKAA